MTSTRAPALRRRLSRRWANSTVESARSWVERRIADGVECPCCEQFVRTYRRQVHSTMAKALVTLYTQAVIGGSLHVRDFAGQDAEISKARYWGLVEAEGNETGFWRLTEDGRSFVEGVLEIRQYALVYNQQLLGHEGDFVSIRDCLGKKFDYDALMDSVSSPG